MAAFLILLVLVAGFLHCHVHPVQKIRLHRYTGQYLYLRAAGYGVRALGIAAAVTFASGDFLPNTFASPLAGKGMPAAGQWLLNRLESAGLGGESLILNVWLLTLSIGMFGVVLLHAASARAFYCLRYLTLDPSKHITGKVLRDSPLDAQLYRLHLTKQMVMLSMADRKVYVGMIISMGEPTETEGPDNEILIIPIRSGYRDKDTLKVEFTTFYKDFYDQQTQSGLPDFPLTLVLRQKDIVSATEFSDSAYAYWNEPKPGGRASPRLRPRYARAN